MNREETSPDDDPTSWSSIEVDQARVHWHVRRRLGLCESDEVPTVRVGRYPIIKRIGRGASAEVFLALDEDLQREIALKLIRPDPAHSPQVADRVLREAQVLARLSHRNIVHAYEVGQHGKSLFIAMERIAGESLERWMSVEPRPWREILSVYLEAGRALQAAHRMGVIHRDFKPGNVIVEDSRPRRVCVVDWGLACPASELRPQQTISQLEMPAEHSAPTWTTGFTPKYAAPEQMLGRGVGPSADQFAFCVSLFEAMFGEPPFLGKTNGALCQSKLEGRVVPYNRGAVPERIVRAIRRGMKANPGDRFRSMQELLEELGPRRSRRWWATASVATIAGVSLTLLPWSDHCLTMHQRVEAHWNDRVRGSIQAAFDAHRLPFAADSFQRLSDDLDLYLAQWERDAELACQSMQREPGGSPGGASESATSWVDCLDRRLHTVDQLLGALSTASAGLVGRAPLLVEELPPLEDCTRLPPPPALVDPITLEKLDEHLGRADASMVLHDWPLALVAATEARALVDAQEHDRSLERYRLEADVAVGRARVRTDDIESGVRLLEDAGGRAEALLDDRLAWRAWSSLGRLGRENSRPKEEIREWLARAESAATRMQDDHRSMMLEFYRVNAELVEAGRREQVLRKILQWADEHGYDDLERASATSLVALLVSSSRPEQAIGPARTAIALADEQFGPRHPDSIKARVNLAQVLVQTCELDEAADVLAPAMDDLVPELHPYHLNLLVTQAMIDLQTGRLSAARRSLEGASGLVESRGGDPRIEQFMGVIAFAEGDFAEARDRFQRVSELADQSHDPIAIGLARASLAEVLLHDGRVHEALELAARAQAALEDDHDLSGAYLAMVFKVQGLGLLRHDDLEQAAERLDSAQRRLAGCEVLEHADLAYARGLVAQRYGREDEGRELLVRAEAGYAQLGELGRLRQLAMRDLLDSPR